MQIFIPIKSSSLHPNWLCKLNADIKPMGSAKIHFEAGSNHPSCNNTTCLIYQEQMCLKRLHILLSKMEIFVIWMLG